MAQTLIALDTNILARLLLADDPKQFKIAKELLSRKQDYAVPITVIQELVWVLESNDRSVAEIHFSLQKLLSLDNLKIANEPELVQTLSMYLDGMDFADALHWNSSQGAQTFLSFDRKFVTKAKAQANAFLPVVKECA